MRRLRQRIHVADATGGTRQGKGARASRASRILRSIIRRARWPGRRPATSDDARTRWTGTERRGSQWRTDTPVPGAETAAGGSALRPVSQSLHVHGAARGARRRQVAQDAAVGRAAALA